MNLNSITETIDKLLWGWPQIIILLGTHLFMSIRTGFIQKDIFKAIRLSVKSDPDAPGDVSQFGALTTALASTVGTANIIGVGTAPNSLPRHFPPFPSSVIPFLWSDLLLSRSPPCWDGTITVNAVQYICSVKRSFLYIRSSGYPVFLSVQLPN